jgi:recombinational DNA repair protein RecT
MKTRTILLGIITLIIGFIIGMLTSAQIRLHRLKPVRMYFSEDRFREGFYKTIQPDEAQKAIIDQILDKYAGKNSEIQNNFRKELDVNMKALRKELDSKLTKEQLSRLKEMDERRQEMIRQGRSRHDNDTTRYRDNRREYPLRPPDSRHTGSEGPQPPPPPFQERDTSRSPDRE